MSRRDVRGSFRRGVLWAATGCVTSAMATQALAALPITFGPGSSAFTLGSTHSPVIESPAHSVSNAGAAIVQYTHGTVSGAELQTLILIPGAANYLTLGTINGGTGAVQSGEISDDGYAGALVNVTSDGTTTGTSLGVRFARYAPGSTTATALTTPFGTLPTNGDGLGSFTAIAAGGGIGGANSTFDGSTYKGSRGLVWTAGGTTASYRNPSTYQLNGNNGGSAVLALNAAGVATGYDERYDATGADRGTFPVRWAPNSSSGVELAVPTADANGASTGLAQVVNSTGTAWGYVSQYGSAGAYLGARPARWDAGSTAITPLGTLGTDINGSIPSAFMTDANDAGTAVGYMNTYTSSFASQGVRAIRWNAGTTAATLLGTFFTGTLNDSTQVVTTAKSVNALGTTAGYSLTADGSAKRAVLWLPGSTTPLDLTPLVTPGNTFIQSLDEADGVSDTGWVSGIATYGSTKYQRAFTMLVPQAGTYGQGDANFDTKVDFNDLVILAQHYGQTNSAQATNVGDFDLNGVTDFNDLVVLAQHYGSMTSITGLGDSSFQADWALARSLVPEPGSLAVAAMGLLPTRRRRRDSSVAGAMEIAARAARA